MQDDDLLSILDEGGPWDICLDQEVLRTVPSLRSALYKAWRASSVGAAGVRIVKMPNSEIVVPAAQIARLWTELDLV